MGKDKTDTRMFPNCLRGGPDGAFDPCEDWRPGKCACCGFDRKVYESRIALIRCYGIREVSDTQKKRIRAVWGQDTSGSIRGLILPKREVVV